MKMILKIFALPVLLLVKVIWLLRNMITNIISYAIGLKPVIIKPPRIKIVNAA